MSETAVRAFVAEQQDGQVERGMRELAPGELGPGEVTVRVQWSSVNYKDALATIPKGQVARISPLVPGIDLAGDVVASDDDAFKPGDPVLVHGYDLGVAHHGGYAELARVPADWVVPLPEDLSARQAMVLGTAGYTAAASIVALEARGLKPGDGPVLVTGATGGVGSIAVGILAARGYEVVASTGKASAHDWLRELGATEIVGREETSTEPSRPLGSQRWGGAVDPVGAMTTAFILSTLRTGAACALSGLTGGTALPSSVLPFVLRGVALLGIDSVNVPIAQRRALWARLAKDLRPRGLDEQIAADEVALECVEQALDAVLGGQLRGRTIVRVGA